MTLCNRLSGSPCDKYSDIYSCVKNQWSGPLNVSKHPVLCAEDVRSVLWSIAHLLYSELLYGSKKAYESTECCLINIHLSSVTWSCYINAYMFNKQADYCPILHTLGDVSSLGHSSIRIDKSAVFTALGLQHHIFWISRSFLQCVCVCVWIRCRNIRSHVSP